LENLLGLLLKLVVNKILEGLAWDTLAGGGFLASLRTRSFIHVLIIGATSSGGKGGADWGRHRSRYWSNGWAVGLNSEGEFALVTHGNSKGQLKIIVVLTDNPAVAVVVAELVA